MARPRNDERWEAPELTDEEIKQWIEDTLQLVPSWKTYEKLGFKTRYAVIQYLKQNPEMKKMLAEANQNAMPWLEEKCRDISSHESNPKMAKVIFDSAAKVLAWNNPAKYGTKLDVSVNQTISIRQNLDKANERVAQILKDVTPGVEMAAIDLKKLAAKK